LLRNLQRVHVDAMSVDDAFGVLDTLGRRMGKPHRTTVGPEALHGALALLARFGRHDALPGSGVALLEQMIRSWPGTTLERQHALDAFCAASGFPLKIVDDTQFIDEDALRASFHDRIIGQPDAVDRLVDLILVVKAGLGDPDKPLGSFLLMGPTGVGKTESAKALAGWLFGSQDRLVRLDMSEFGAWGSARRLIDGPGGQGLLTRKIREKPFCVLLLDEVEKAEPGVFDVLLQVLGEGRLTDGTGATVSFRHVIILMTSNLGASNRKRVGLVGESADAADRRYRRAAEDFFRPELVNRIDALVPFRSLDQHDVRTIARGMLTSALDRDGIRRRGVEVTWGDDLLDHLCEVGFDPRYGARPMKRAIDDHVMAVIARELVSRPDATRLALRVVDGAVVL
jgi:ATP-dependent Clp protease ATP-binding subunit ClpC